MHPDQRQVLVGAEHVDVGLQQLGPDQHRVDAADEEEHADPDEVLERHDLVVGAQAEITAEPFALGLVLGKRRRVAEQPVDRVIGEPEPDQEAEHAEQVAEQDRDVVLSGLCGEVVEARRVDQAADPVAEQPPDDREDDPGQ